MKRFSVFKWITVSVLSAGLGLAAVPFGASGGGNGLGGGSGSGGGNGSAPGQIKRRFATSLHATRMGKPRFYSAFWDIDGDGILEDNQGFEHSVVDIYDLETADYENLPCKNCHYPPAVASEATDTDDNLFPGDCTDCHWNYGARDYGVPADDIAYCDVDPTDAVVIETCPEGYDPATRFSQDGVCIACHGRQGAEHKLLTDVHRTIDAESGEAPQFTCMACHQETEVHGDGVLRESHLDAPKTSCAQSGCHEDELRISPRKGKKASEGACEDDEGEENERCETFHERHVKNVDCTACHVAENTSCNSCHFDSELDHRKRFYRQIPAKGFKFLMNFKDIQNPKVTKVRTATYQSLTVGAVCTGGNCDFDPEDRSQVQTFVVFAPYASHSVTKAEELECLDCHVVRDEDGGYEGNPAVAQYLTDGTITTTTWNPDAGVAGMLEGPTGIIPLPSDWISETGEKGTLDMDFVHYLGDTTDPVTKNPEGDDWAFLKTGPDRGHMPYGTPLSAGQMQKLILKNYDDDDDEEENGKKKGKR